MIFKNTPSTIIIIFVSTKKLINIKALDVQLRKRTADIYLNLTD